MNPKNVITALLLVVAAILCAVAALVPPARGTLLCLAAGIALLAFAVQAWP